ncbi:tetratricopeptide repeat protein [Lutibaculum baratangense]|uniref:Uncharacterized protein n=1 Tax=Lutibaculum baratangense AMV1 TaxID=631454 RepID=V4RK17_9HYPH|nr:hypothetical protein [Lutibaculum baratangense]ESR26386.1 hypothetical protein N177_0886 [Lutibaculum baratangense AMV1]
MPRTLYLHVGHSKTGSSYIQASLARSVRSLECAGIWYPPPPDLQLAASGGITSGNGRMLMRHEVAPDEVPAGCHAILFSGEHLFEHLLAPAGRREVADWATAAGADAIEVLLFIRDPIEQVASDYQQAVKRHGSTMSIDDYASRYDKPVRVRDTLVALREIANIRAIVRNYSRVRGSLLRETAEWLGVSETLLEPPAARQVNRSLTAGELTLQRALNAWLGASSPLLSDPLCEKLPDITADEIRPSIAAQEAFWQRLGPCIAEVNALVEPEHRYRHDVAPGRERSAAPDYLFSEAQLELIGRSFGAMIKKLRAALKQQQALTQFAVGDKHMLHGQPEVAAQAYRKALEFEPRHAGAMVGLAQALLHVDPSSDEPLRLVSEAEAIAPKHPRLVRLKARLAERAVRSATES